MARWWASAALACAGRAPSPRWPPGRCPTSPTPWSCRRWRRASATPRPTSRSPVTGSSGAHSGACWPRRHIWRCRALAATAGPAATAAAVAHRIGEVAGGESGMDGSRAVRADRPRGVLPRQRRLDTPGEDHLRSMRGAAGVPGLRARRRRAVRRMGGPQRARAPPRRRRPRGGGAVTLRRYETARGHWYKLDGVKVDGVTTLIGQGLPKPALPYWAARCVAEYVADNLDQVVAMADMGRASLVAALKEVPWTKRDTAAAKGAEVHALAERLAAGDEVDVPEHLAGYVESCVAFLDDYQVRPIRLEAPIGSRTWRYAGT